MATKKLGNQEALKKWREACKKHGYPKKVNGKMRVSPKKGSADYRKVRKSYKGSK